MRRLTCRQIWIKCGALSLCLNLMLKTSVKLLRIGKLFITRITLCFQIIRKLFWRIGYTLLFSKICSLTIYFRLRNSNGSVVFTCRIIHSVKMMTSVVQVFFQDKLAAIAHVIGTDQLPIKSQVNLCWNWFFITYFVQQCILHVLPQKTSKLVTSS